MKLRAPKKLKPTMARVYPERKWIKEKRHQTEKGNIKLLKQTMAQVRYCEISPRCMAILEFFDEHGKVGIASDESN
jgi:hypothetical protein